GIYASHDVANPELPGHAITITNNIVTNTLSGGAQAPTAIYVHTSENVRVNGNHVSDSAGAGISYSNNENTSVEANTVARASYGIGSSATARTANIIANIISECGQGIVNSGNQTRIANNTITNGTSASSLHAL